MFILDTNIVSELIKARPAQAVTRWIAGQPAEDLHISVAVVAELWDGVSRLPQGRRRDQLSKWLNDELLPGFAGRIVPVDEELAVEWGRCSARLKQAGRNDTAVDALIGATAIVMNCPVVTRNVRDFEPLGVPLLNPWNVSPD